MIYPHVEGKGFSGKMSPYKSYPLIQEKLHSNTSEAWVVAGAHERVSSYIKCCLKREVLLSKVSSYARYLCKGEVCVCPYGRDKYHFGRWCPVEGTPLRKGGIPLIQDNPKGKVDIHVLYS